METTIVYWGYIGIMENNMKTTIVCWGYAGIMEKKMENTFDVTECLCGATMWRADSIRSARRALV